MTCGWRHRCLHSWVYFHCPRQRHREKIVSGECNSVRRSRAMWVHGKQVKSNEKVCADIQLFSSVFFMLFCCHQTLNVFLKGTSLTGQGRGPEKKTSFLLLSYFGRKIKGDRERMHRRTVTWNTTHDHIRATQEWQAEIMTKMALEEFKFQAAVNLLLPIGCYDVWPHSIFQITLESKSAWCTIDTEPVRVHPKI